MPVSFPGSPQPNKTNKLGSARIAQDDKGKGSTKHPAKGHGGKTSAKVGFRGLGLMCSEVWMISFRVRELCAPMLAKHAFKEEGPSTQAARRGSGAQNHFRFGA